MVSVPTSRAVGRSMKKKKEEDDEIAVCQFPELTLMGRSSDAVIVYR